MKIIIDPVSIVVVTWASIKIGASIWICRHEFQYPTWNKEGVQVKRLFHHKLQAFLRHCMINPEWGILKMVAFLPVGLFTGSRFLNHFMPWRIQSPPPRCRVCKDQGKYYLAPFAGKGKWIKCNCGQAEKPSTKTSKPDEKVDHFKDMQDRVHRIRFSRENSGHAARIKTWLESNDTGVSSVTILSILDNRPMNTISGFWIQGNPIAKWSAPLGAADFGRCARLIDLFPEWENRLHEVAAACPKWYPIVTNWTRLKALYDDIDLYKMKTNYKGGPVLELLDKEVREARQDKRSSDPFRYLHVYDPSCGAELPRYCDVNSDFHPGSKSPKLVVGETITIQQIPRGHKDWYLRGKPVLLKGISLPFIAVEYERASGKAIALANVRGMDLISRSGLDRPSPSTRAYLPRIHEFQPLLNPIVLELGDKFVVLRVDEGKDPSYRGQAFRVTRSAYKATALPRWKYGPPVGSLVIEAENRTWTAGRVGHDITTVFGCEGLQILAVTDEYIEASKWGC